MKITRSVRIPLLLPDEGAPGYTAPIGHRWILASELADSLNTLVGTLPPEARFEGVVREMNTTYLALVWDEELPERAS